MPKKPNGEPFVNTVNFGTYYCALWRWDDGDPWRFLNNKTGARRQFPSSYEAIRETIRVKCKAKSQRVVADADEFGIREIGLIHPRYPGTINVRLAEIINPTRLYIRGFYEPCFGASRFRKVQPRKIDISIFTAMLNPAKEREPV